MKATKYENEYFSLAESIYFQIDVNTGKIHFEELDKMLHELFPYLVSEILENSTQLKGNNRKIYYERIKTRAIQMGMDIQFVDEKPGQWNYTYEGELTINPPITDGQYKGFDKYVIHKDENGNEYTLGKEGVEARKKILVRHKNILIQQIKRYFPDLVSKLSEQVLTVPDWCIIFYYLDEAGLKEGNKIDRMEAFIKDNKVVNPSGILTTKGNFKKEYHEIENRINGKKDKNPLPPERIENILPYLKNNKKALQAAENDIEHLNDEIEENKRNTY